MRRTRGIAGSIALLAMLLSLSEGLLAGVCVGGAVPADAGAAAAHAAMGHGGASAEAHRDSSVPAEDAAPLSHDGPACPLSGGALTACGGGAVLPPARIAALATFVAETGAPVPAGEMPAFRAAVDLFHPPRA